jgi:recombination protein RecA
MILGAKPVISDNVYPTGAISLDMALGVGGMPRGRIIEIYGPESSGKTTLCLAIIAEAQKRGGICAYVDAEHAMDPTYAKSIGVDVDELLINQPDYGEQGIDIAEALVDSGSVSVIIIDSVAALVPKAELDADMEGAQPGLQARLMGKALRKLSAKAAQKNTMIIFINQLREKIGVMFGSPETTPGGKALKFWASVRIDIRRREGIKNGDVQIGNHIEAKVIKNKVAPPFQMAKFDIIFGKGVDREGTILTMAVDKGLIDKAGSWYAYKDERIAQGADKATAWLVEHVAECDQIEARLKDPDFKPVLKAMPPKKDGDKK